MKYWHDFIDSLDSDGGHIVVLLLLIFGGVIALHFQVMSAEHIIDGAVGALLLALKDAGSNKERNDHVEQP